MTAAKASRPLQTPAPNPRGHNYCWAEHPSGVRCCEPTGHPPRDGGGGHVYPYTPRTEW